MLLAIYSPGNLLLKPGTETSIRGSAKKANQDSKAGGQKSVRKKLGLNKATFNPPKKHYLSTNFNSLSLFI